MDKQTEEKFYKFLREGNKVDAYHLLVEERKKQVYLKTEQSKLNCFPKASFNPSQILHFQDKDKTTRIAIKSGENKYSFHTLNKKIKQKTQETYYELEPDKQGDSIFSENKERYIISKVIVFFLKTRKDTLIMIAMRLTLGQGGMET